MNRLGCAAGAALALAAPAAAQDERPKLVDTPSFRADVFGYLRAGVGWLGDPEDGRRRFQLPGATAKDRPGNECEIRIEHFWRRDRPVARQGASIPKRGSTSRETSSCT